jgi:hypothetical protein
MTPIPKAELANNSINSVIVGARLRDTSITSVIVGAKLGDNSLTYDAKLGESSTLDNRVNKISTPLITPAFIKDIHPNSISISIKENSTNPIHIMNSLDPSDYIDFNPIAWNDYPSIAENFGKISLLSSIATFSYLFSLAVLRTDTYFYFKISVEVYHKRWIEFSISKGYYNDPPNTLEYLDTYARALSFAIERHSEKLIYIPTEVTKILFTDTIEATKILFTETRYTIIELRELVLDELHTIVAPYMHAFFLMGDIIGNGIEIPDAALVPLIEDHSAWLMDYAHLA